MLPNQINPDDYWSIEVSGVSWQYVIGKLCLPLAKINPNEAAVLFKDEGGVQTYMLKREFVNAATLAHVTGMDIAAVKKLKALRLSEKDREDLPKPTVNYWGEA
jgi:hypothetical protein